MFTGLIRYLLIGFGFLLFLISFFVSFETINSSSRLLGEIKEKHFRFFSITETIRQDIQQHQSEIYLFLIYKHDFQQKYHYSSIVDVHEKIKELVRLSSDLDMNEASSIISDLHKQIQAYKEVEGRLVLAFEDKSVQENSHQVSEYKDSIIDIYKTITNLTNIAKQSFLDGVNDLMLTIERSKHYIFFVLIGGLIILMVSFTSLIRNNKKFALQLERAQDAEKRQKELQLEVVAYSNNLEKEVAKKTAEVSYRFYHNSLTNLPNRQKLGEFIETADEPKLALLNIDKFQHFNDYFGTKRGDNAIIFLANKLNYLVHEPLMLFHLGGDEFAIFADASKSKDQFITEVKAIFEQVKSFEIIEADNRLILNITAGVAVGEEGIFSKADIALKRAKQYRYEFLLYDNKKRIRENFLKHLNQLRELNFAINHDNIEIYLQPICDAKTKAVEKYEVLARMRDSSGKILSPIDFLNVAKEAKLYPKITETVFQKTMQLINSGTVKCSMNISIDDILNKRTRSMIMEGLEKCAYAEHITFELLESEDIEKYNKVQAFINDIKSFGSKLAIDDFGTGYSNFDHLMHLDANFLKIDGSLVKGLEDDILSQNFVKAMVRFAKELGIKTVAEYVSSEAIYEELLKYGIDYVQGFWLGKPEPVEFYIKNLS